MKLPVEIRTIFIIIIIAFTLGTSANKKREDDSTKTDIENLKSQVKQLQGLLHQLKSGDKNQPTGASRVETTREREVDDVASHKDEGESQGNQEWQSRERLRIEDILNSFTVDDIKALDNIRDYLKNVAKYQQDHNSKSRYQHRLDNLYRELQQLDRDSHQDNKEDSAKNDALLNSRRTFVPQKRPEYRDRADEALQNSQRTYEDSLSKGSVGKFGDFDDTSDTPTRNAKLREIETKLLSDLQSGAKDGISLEDIISDLGRLKSKGNLLKKRRLLNKEERDLQALKNRL